jgi:hypothetical protein
MNTLSTQASRISATVYAQERLINTEGNSAVHIENRRIEAKIEVTIKL